MQGTYQVRDHCAHCFEIKVDNIDNPTTMQIVLAFRVIISFLSVNFHIEIAADGNMGLFLLDLELAFKFGATTFCMVPLSIKTLSLIIAFIMKDTQDNGTRELAFSQTTRRILLYWMLLY
jgi:hypothetical protein